MTQENLRRLLSFKGKAATIIDDLIRETNTSLGIWDVEGNPLLGSINAHPDEMLVTHAVLCDSEIVGWVSGGDQAEFVAALLTYLVTQEIEKEELLDEILDLYRQVNLLFKLSEKLTASLDLNTVAKVTLDEASRLIKATCGAVVLSDEEHDLLPIATMGQAIPAQLESDLLCGFIDAVLANAKAEIINELCSDTRYIESKDSIRSLICAPLMSKNMTMGAILIANQASVTYTAADLNLLNTLATQAAPAIENALLYEKKLREAQEREEQLKRQVLELRIELDEVRQKEKVAEITGSEYYQRLRDRADSLRSIIGDTDKY